MERHKTDLLELLASGDPPAFASDEDHRIVFWNRGAERLLGRSAAQALGHRCFDALAGRDVFGNRFCYAGCPVAETLRRQETVNPLELQVTCATGERLLSLTTYQVRGEGPASLILVHVLHPIDEGGRLGRLLAHLERSAAVPPRPAKMKHDPVERRPHGNALTTREQEVLACIAAGLQNKEVAQALGISVATARNHVHRILEKLGVHSKLEALSLYVRNGWAESLPRVPLQALDSGRRLA